MACSTARQGDPSIDLFFDQDWMVYSVLWGTSSYDGIAEML